jgi:hypothetical protein
MGQNILLMVGDSEAMTDLVDIVITSVSGDTTEPFYVSNMGIDANDGSEVAPFSTLLKAYEAASADDKRKTIVVLTDLATADAVELNAENSLTITISGVGQTPPVLTRTSGTGGSVIEISNQAKVKFQNITINGKEGGTNRALSVSGAGTKVTLVKGATLTGEITSYYGGGVYVEDRAWLVLSGGEIVNSYAHSTRGGGVYVKGGSIFRMLSGKISGNTADSYGGGVCFEGSTFAMEGGTISGNTVNGDPDAIGGGVYAANIGGPAVFTMKGGTISGNHAENQGGGFGSAGVNINIITGVIYGTDELEESLKNDANNGNAAVYHSLDHTGNVNTSDFTVHYLNGASL